MQRDYEGMIAAARRHENAIVVSGSRLMECNRCGHEVTLAPTGQKRVAAQHIEVVCTVCMLEHMQSNPGAKFEPITPEQRAEIDATMRRN